MPAREINRLPGSIRNRRKKPPSAAGSGVTRHPGADNRPVDRSPHSLISGCLFAAARSGQGRAAAKRTLDGEDLTGDLSLRMGFVGISSGSGGLRVLSLPRVSRKRTAPVSGGVFWSSAEINATAGAGPRRPLLVLHQAFGGRGGPGRLHNSSLSDSCRQGAPRATAAGLQLRDNGHCVRGNLHAPAFRLPGGHQRFGGVRPWRSASDGAGGCLPCL